MTLTATAYSEDAATDSYEKIVKEIRFQGNTLNKSRALIKKVKTKKNKVLDPSQIQKDVKILFETGYFDDVEVKIESLDKINSKNQEETRVTYVVLERPIIKRIDYKGNMKVKRGSFEDKIQSLEGEPFDRFKADLDERVILEYYRNEGYASAEVEHYTSIDVAEKKMILTFFITEGDRVIVKDIQIDGVKNFRPKKVLKQMETRRKKVFKREVLQADQARIENFYKNKGFVDVVVSTPTHHIDEERNEATIKLTVNSGPKYRVGKIQFVGASIFTDKELRKQVKLKKGKLFKQKDLDETIANISNIYCQ